MYFTAICMIRGSLAVRICPNCELFMAVTGAPNRVWLMELNDSARNVTDWRSVIGKERERAMSRFHAPGFRIVLLDRFPNVFTVTGEYAAVLNH